ncbi:MAG: UDP-N-acetylmuramoyl-L-alanyl-D-glutamate--2,6-diaminopimelate ligase [Bacteroidota bacterium]
MKRIHVLSTLLQGVVVDKRIGDPAVQVQAISFDSRNVSPGTLFVAVKGTKTDGHAYISQAVEAGSTVVVCEQAPSKLSENVTYVVVADSAKALGMIASNFYGRPSKQLQLVAVTGTNGKTSTVHLLTGLFRKLGYKVGMLSTIHNQINGETLPSALTTPDAIQVNRLLTRMVAEGCQYCFMEASSHALVQERMAGLQLAGAVFLNITHDHLDYHKTFDAYIQAKKKLFDELPAGAFALYNVDDKRGAVMIQNTQAIAHSFALKTPAAFTAKLIANTLQGLELRMADQTAWFQLVGTFNAYNLLAAYATACLLGADSQQAIIALSALTPIQGRFQHLHAPTGFDAIVDYAHTPDALQNVLKTIGQIKSKASQVITVVGCGGDRDKTKRPLMAQVAWKFSDRVILTADNPRTEAPQAIIEDMKAGLTPTQQQQTLVIVERAEAIKAACQLAKAQDIVLIAGKGHETYQEISGKRYPFDDRQVLEEVLF